MKYWTGNLINKLEPNYIFVFGSNPEGRHGAGAAKHAMKFGAVYGKGRGLHGQTYALPTKNLKVGYVENLLDGSFIEYSKAGFKSLTNTQIINNIEELYECCNLHKDLKFFITYKRYDKNLNGYSGVDMWVMFNSTNYTLIPVNVYFHESFK